MANLNSYTVLKSESVHAKKFWDEIEKDPKVTGHHSSCCNKKQLKIFIGKVNLRKPLFKCPSCEKFYKLTDMTLTSEGWK